jgi:hypothetical protein
MAFEFDLDLCIAALWISAGSASKVHHRCWPVCHTDSASFSAYRSSSACQFPLSSLYRSVNRRVNVIPDVIFDVSIAMLRGPTRMIHSRVTCDEADRVRLPGILPSITLPRSCASGCAQQWNCSLNPGKPEASVIIAVAVDIDERLSIRFPPALNSERQLWNRRIPWVQCWRPVLSLAC